MEYYKSENSSRILRASGFWDCFRIHDILFQSASNWHAKWINFFRPGITQTLTAARRSQFTLRASLRHLKYRKSKNSSRILRLSGFWDCFWTCDIPLPSASNWHAKCINFSRPGSVRICVWEKGVGLVRSILTCSHLEYTKHLQILVNALTFW